MRRGDQEAREALICANLRFAMVVAKKYRGMVRDHADLIQAANMGLVMAVDKYKPSMNVRVISFAAFWMRQMITRSISAEREFIHVSSSVGTKLRAALRAGYNGGDGGEDCIAQAAKIKGVVSLEAPALLMTVKKMAAPTRQNSPEVAASQSESAQIAARYLSRLSSKQQHILRKRYGLGGADTKTYRQIGRKIGVCHERVRQIHDQALDMCRRLMALDRIDAEVEALVREIENAA